MARNRLELLSPAGSIDALKAALANGADAVYLGAAAFGARASAGFDEAQLREAIALAHLRRKNIYVTVNILVKERELENVRSTLSLLSHVGADAVLVQDLGVLKICREEFPELPVHASTQMAIHNENGVKWLREAGVRRAVMARECDLAALRRAADTGLEIEAFCHGAMCVSVSGQCLLSAMIGGRSGNRGRCAQPCRLPYSYRGEAGAWLSPRDLCARDEVQALADAGVYSFKIEGRLKRPEYVAIVTRAYRAALDAVLEGRFAPMDPAEREELTQIFSRGGFSLGYPGTQRDAAIVDPTRVTPVGVVIGTTGKTYQKGGALLCEARLTKALHNGDGLEAGGQTILYSGPDTPPGAVALLRVRSKIRPGEAVRRTEDERQLAAARSTYEGEALNEAVPIPFDAVLEAAVGEKLTLTVTDGESRVTVQGDACQAAQHKALDEDGARRAIGKTGGTPFALRSLDCRSASAFAPASALNALRREALDRLSQARIAAQPREAAAPARFFAPQRRAAAPRLLVKTQRVEDIPSLLRAGADAVIFLPQDFREEALSALARSGAFSGVSPEQALLCLPGQCTQETLEAIARWAEKLPLGICLSSPSQLGAIPRSGMAGEGIPVMNGEAIRLLAHLGCESVTLSRELSRQEAAALPDGPCEMILPVYGRTRLMLLNHCPARTQTGLKEGRAQCALCAQGKGAQGTCLVDRMQAAYPLLPLRLPEGCVIEMMDSRPIDLAPDLAGMERFSWLLTLTDEPAASRVALTKRYAALLRGSSAAPLPAAGWPGRFLNGVL